MPPSATLPPPVAAALAGAFPALPLRVLAPTLGGFSNLSLYARIGDHPCVIKAADTPTKRADLRREARVLTLLYGRRIGTPRPLAFTDNDGWTALVTARRRGLPGIRLYAGNPEALEAPLIALGRTLARLHRLALPPPSDAAPLGLLLAERAIALTTALEDLPIPPKLRGPLVEALAHPAWHAREPRLVHGDAGLHNVLWAPRAFTLLDWELAGWGDQRLDLAWIEWTMRFRGLPSRCRTALRVGYAAEAPLQYDEEALRALALGQVAALLVRAAGKAAWEEWLSRTRWTLASWGHID